jgi:hypothetical protein
MQKLLKNTEDFSSLEIGNNFDAYFSYIEVKNRLSSTFTHDKLLSSTRLLPPFLTDKVIFQSPTREKKS